MKVLNRSALNRKLKKYISSPVVIAAAPSGFGKTTGLRQFLSNEDIHQIWFSLYGECDENWAWEKIIKQLNQIIPDFSYSAPIPTSRKSIDEFIEVLQPYLDKPIVIVLDDADIPRIPALMEFLTTYSHDYHRLIHFFIISTGSMADFLAFPFANNVLSLTVNDFMFRKEEVILLCKNESSLLSNSEIDIVYQQTQGWIIAIQLTLNAYRLFNSLENHSNLNSLIEKVLYKQLSPQIQKDFIKLSLLKEFPLELAYQICENNEIIEKIMQLEKEHYFIQKTSQEQFMIIPIFKDFLSEQLFMSSINKDTIYQQAGNFYLSHNHPLEAIQMYLQCHAFTEIMNVLDQYKDIGFGDISPQLYINVFEALPEVYKNKYPYIYLKWILDSITNFPQIDGLALLENFKYRIETNQLNGDHFQLYGEYYFVHAFTYYNDVMKMIDDFKQSYQYFNGGYSKLAYPFMIATFGSYHLLFLYYNKVGDLKDIVSFIKQNAHYFVHISRYINNGCENLIEAEYLYETGTYDCVKTIARIAYREAMSKNQTSIAISSLFLQGRLALLKNNIRAYHTTIDDLNSFYNKTDISIIHCEIDCALAHLHILNNELDKVPQWLKDGEDESSLILPEANMVVHIVHGLYLIKQRNTIKLKEVADMIEASNTQQVHVFAFIYSKLFRVIYHYENNQFKDALDILKDTISICEKDHIITPVVELSFAFFKLLELFVPQNNFEAFVIDSCMKQSHMSNNLAVNLIPLSPKEKQVLALLAQNSTARNIAEELNISINTVQTHMKSIYSKLNIKSKIDAIHYYENNH